MENKWFSPKFNRTLRQTYEEKKLSSIQTSSPPPIATPPRRRKSLLQNCAIVHAVNFPLFSAILFLSPQSNGLFHFRPVCLSSIMHRKGQCLIYNKNIFLHFIFTFLLLRAEQPSNENVAVLKVLCDIYSICSSTSGNPNACLVLMSSPTATASFILYNANNSQMETLVELHGGSFAVYPSPQTQIHQQNRKTMFYVYLCRSLPLFSREEKRTFLGISILQSSRTEPFFWQNSSIDQKQKYICALLLQLAGLRITASSPPPSHRCKKNG